jgi:hypothetical protein
LLARIRGIAEELAGSVNGGAPPEMPSPEAVRAAAVECMRRAGNDERAAHSAMAVLIAGEWVDNVARLVADLDRPVKAAVAAAGIQWWR